MTLRGKTLTMDYDQLNKQNVTNPNWYIGQKVWDEVLKPNQEGKITSIEVSDTYPLEVTFTDGQLMIYSHDGSFHTDFPPTLKSYPHRIEVIRKEPDFERGQIVLVRDTNAEYWRAARYESSDDGVYRANNWRPNNNGNYWKQCIPFEGNEHLLLTTDTPS